MDNHAADEPQHDPGKLELIAHRSFSKHPELVYIIDFLNKNLKHKGVMFGLRQDKQNDQMVINIYEF